VRTQFTPEFQPLHFGRGIALPDIVVPHSRVLSAGTDLPRGSRSIVLLDCAITASIGLGDNPGGEYTRRLLDLLAGLTCIS
jgi:hypothetical protein